MKESNIAYENKTAWIFKDTWNRCYTVLTIGITHSTSDSSYELSEDGLSIAKMRADYLSKTRP